MPTSPGAVDGYPRMAGVYSAADLEFFDSVLQGAVAELRSAGHPLVATHTETDLRRRLATAIFHFADIDGRNYLALKREALNMVLHA